MTKNKKLLLVDDDPILRRLLVEQLQLQQEFVVSEAETASKTLQEVKDAQFDMILLDVGLPDMDGRSLCKQMRESGVSSPIIMLTGAKTDTDTISGLEAGANDYVTKPFRFGVLMARIRAHIRQHEQSEDAIFAIGPYRFEAAARSLIDEQTGRKIRLTDKEASILKYLYRADGRIASRDVLLDEVWGYNAGVTTHTLETHVYRLRQKIEENPSEAKILVTEKGGYRLIP